MQQKKAAAPAELESMRLSRRDMIRLAAASLVPAIVGADVLGDSRSSASAAGNAPAMLQSHFMYDASTAARLMATPPMLQQCQAYLRSNDADARRLLASLREHHAAVAGTLRENYQMPEPDFSFGARSALLDAVIGYRLLAMTHSATSADRDAVVGAAMDLVDALHRAGKTTVDLHVGQASNMMPLAVAYDWMYDDLSPDQRRKITSAMLDYSIRPTLEALYGYDPRAWWVNGMNNWTTICIGGAVAGVLALRKADDPGPFAVQINKAGDRRTRSFLEHADDLLTRGLQNLRRPLIQLASNNGLWGEGPGYQHDAMMPWFSTIVSVESALRVTRDVPAVVQNFLADGRQGAMQHVRSSLHLATPLESDFGYSDGTWPLTNQPINLLIADYARQGGAPLWRAVAWQAAHRGGASDLAMHLLYRSQFDWDKPTDAPRGMAGFTIATAPTGIYFYDHKAALPVTDAPVPNPHVVIWRQRWADPNAAAVMFKGGDNRMDYHSHLDVGSFTYDSQGVNWAIDLGRADGYIPYVRDGIPGYRPNSVVFFQPYPKRACGHNTLVLNSAVNDYTQHKIKAPWDWLWQINPDQALFDPDAWSPVQQVQMGDSQDVWRAAVDLAPVYQHHGAGPGSTRAFAFDRASGALTITDDLKFEKPANDLWWFMHVAASTVPVHADGRRIVLSADRADGTPVYVEVSLLKAPATKEGLAFGLIQDRLPPGQPSDQWLWGHKNAAAQKRTIRKLSLHCENVAGPAQIVMRLRPLPEWAGKPLQSVQTLLSQAPATPGNGVAEH